MRTAVASLSCVVVLSMGGLARAEDDKATGKEAAKAPPKKVAPPKAVPPKTVPPKATPQPSKVEAPKAAAAKAEAPKAAAEKAEAPKAAAAKAEAAKAAAAKAAAAKAATPVPAAKTVAPKKVPKREAATPQPFVSRATVSLKTHLNLRSGPGTDFPILSKLDPGAPLDTTARSAQTANRPDKGGKFRWYKVNVGGKEGWVWGGYLSMGGVTPEKRAWKRSPSATPAEAKEKGRTSLAPDKIKAMLDGYRKQLESRTPSTKPATTSATAAQATQTTQATQTAAASGACTNACLDLSKFKPYGQGDPRWANDHIGTSDTRSIRQVGCCLTSWSMLLQFYGKDLPPGELNKVLRDKGAFNGADLNQSKIADVVGFKVKDTRDLGQSWEVNRDRALSTIRENFARKPARPMLLQVDYNSDADKAGNHFVTVTGVDERGDPIIYDPGESKNRGIPLSQVKTHGGYLPLRALLLEGNPK